MALEKSIEFKAATLQIIHALLRSAEPAAIAATLAELTGGTTDFFSGEPAVLDLEQLAELPESVDWAALVELLRRNGLSPFGVRGAAGELAAAAAAAGLVPVDANLFGRLARPAKAAAVGEALPPPTPPAAPVAVVAAALAPAAAPVVEQPRTLFIDKPLRSGQRIYARGGDLVVLAMVSAGAEVIADGSIHVYAPLRGRALAGASGDKAARVLTTCLQAELVSVAGVYRTFEGGLPAGLEAQPARISLVEDDKETTLRIEALPIR